MVLAMSNDIPLETPQMSMKKGLQLFREGGELAVKKEMQQLHDQHVLSLVNKNELTNEQYKEAIGLLMFLKHKHCWKIKGQGCTNGCKQRAYITKEESMSPTVTTEVVFLAAVSYG